MNSIEKYSEVERIEILGSAAKSKSTTGGWKPTEDQITIGNRAVSILLAIPGHAEYYRDRLLKAQSEHKEDFTSTRAGPKFNNYTNEVADGMAILSQLPSPETVMVLGDLLFNEWVLPNSENRPPQDRYGPLSVRALRALSKLPLTSKPAKTTHDSHAARDLSAWQLWYEQIKAGTRTFRFEGDPTEYDLNGPAPKSKLVRIEREQKRNAKRSVVHKKTTPNSRAESAIAQISKPSSIAGILAACALCAAAVWYFLKGRKVA